MPTVYCELCICLESNIKSGASPWSWLSSSPVFDPTFDYQTLCNLSKQKGFKSTHLTTHTTCHHRAKPESNQSPTMKSVFTSLFLLALLPSAFAHPTNPFNTRDTCPNCNPNPTLNRCDATTSCIEIPASLGGGDVCACRAGYRAADKLSDTSVQWRLPWTDDQGISQEGRVFVAPGTVCNTLCNDWEQGKDGCTEVTLRNSCA